MQLKFTSLSKIYEFNDEKLPTKQEMYQNQVDNSEVSKPLEGENSENRMKSEFKDDDFGASFPDSSNYSHTTDHSTKCEFINENHCFNFPDYQRNVFIDGDTEPVFQILYHT